MAFLTGFLVAKTASPDLVVVKKSVVDELRQKLDSKIEKDLIPVFGIFPERAVLISLSGELVKVDAQNNLLEVRVKNNYQGGDFFDYLNQPDSYWKKVKVDEETKILARKEKEREEFIKEIEEYQGERFPPMPYLETETSFENLKEGQDIYVESEIEFKLEENQEIKAKVIRVEE